MPVAPTYQGFEQITEPTQFFNGKMYVQLLDKKGKVRTVRWYSEKEAGRLWPENAKKEVGFLGKDEVIVYTGQLFARLGDFKEAQGCEWDDIYLWHSWDKPSDDLPDDIKHIEIQWKELVGLSKNEIAQKIERIVYED